MWLRLQAMGQTKDNLRKDMDQNMNQSVWQATENLPKFEALHQDKKTDVLIIGGGLCGILCAYFLKQAGVDYMLVEGARIASGMTQHTTAKITSQHGLVYDKMIHSCGKEKAQLYLEANQQALDRYRLLAKNIDCDFEEKNAYVYSRRSRSVIEKEVRAVNILGFRAEFEEHVPLPFETKGAVMFPGQAQFHPLKFIRSIVEDLNIYENTFVKNVENHMAWSNGSNIHADKIIVATHFPFLNQHGSYWLKLYQHRSYVIALENAENVDGMYLDESQKGMSFRNYKDLLFVGGGSHRTGKSGGSWEELRAFAKACYPDAREKYSWAAQDCMSLDGIPYIGHYSRRTPNLYVASGFQKWGMTSSMVAAMLLSDMVMEKDNPWQEVYLPSRNIIKPQLICNGLEAVKNLLQPSFRRCPHMGCALKWNQNEHTWDCACHGSRFGKNGTLINNPAKQGMSKVSDSI